MADVLKAWLRTRLGVLMDLTPDMFGRYTRDGTLLAQILHSYGIISSSQLSTIIRTQDPAVSRVNLRTLRIWLKLINVTLNDDCINDISKGKGAAALQLFYKVYLSLEGKDRLHFIALQKEREKFTPTSSRFEVCKVSEDPPPYHPPEHPLSKPLIKAADTVFWHRNKFWTITEACRRERRRFEAIMEYPVVEPVEYFIPEEMPKRKEESERLDEFARRYPARKMKKGYQVVECCPGKKSLAISCIKDSAAAAQYVDSLKKRSEKAAKSHELKLKSQAAMMTDAWEQLLRKQDRSFDEALGRRVLDQSRYEKRMMRKLCEVWDLRNRIVENRRIVDAMLLRTMESEHRFSEDRCREITKGETEDVEVEACRMRELRRKIRDEKVRRMREKHQAICAEILRDLTDIAVKIAQYRQTNNSHISYSIWSECRTLFLKSQSIFEDFDEIVEIEDKGETENAEEIRNKIQITITLANTDFENYQDLAAPWDKFVPEREQEAEEAFRLGCIVLGYIVHRLLEILYPSPVEVVPRPVPRVKVAAIILGITNFTLHEQLRELLKDSGIRLLRMEDAINHCLERYKQEMSHVKYIDLNIVSVTAKDVKRLETKSKIDDPRERHLKRMEKTKVMTPRSDAVAEEKQTQTPRQIPYDDTDSILSDTACTGKWIYEFLMLGQPISNELNTKILIEYLKEIEDIKGWALVNYPNTYEQMAMLEKALTGREVPPDRKVINFADINIEDIDPSSPRIVFEENGIDALAICRQSRLLLNPISRIKDPSSTSTTFMTIYIKVMAKPGTLDNQEQPCIPIPEDASSMDEFYTSENIAYRFFCSVFDRPALKQLTELIMGQFSTKKSTLELYEEVSQTHHGKQNSQIDSRAAIIKRLVPKSKWESSQCEEKKDVEPEIHDLQAEVKTQLVNDHIRPGEDNWQWLDLPQSPVLLEVLGTLWESVEEAYIESLKEILSLKRMHASSIVPYKDLVLRNLMQFVERPDKRQILLQDFHRAFNEVDEDLREDMDMKCELHCRVDDFRTELWELCDARRHQAEQERRRVLRNQWIPVEATILVNVYTGILQVEIDRFVDTMQLLQDYYTSMSQKLLQDSRFSKVVLDHIEMEDFLWETSSSTDKDEQPTSKTKNESIKASTQANIDRFRIEIENLLIDVSKSFDPDESSVYNFIKDNIGRVRDVADSISSIVLETLKKEEKIALPKTDMRSKDIDDTSSDSTFTNLVRRSRDLVEEWRYAVSYKREIESISEMANVFCFAIEEKKAIQQELLLDGDRFVVRPNVLMFPEDPERSSVSIKEALSPLRFRMVQLGRLIDIFRRIAPRGNISERALVYVLQDLVSCDEKDCYPSSVPCAWRQLRPPDIERLIKGLFGAAERIEWREFVLYAMDLPMPTHQDILRARTAFGMQDLDSRKVVGRNEFHSTPLWFLETTLLAERNSHKDPRKDVETLPVEGFDHSNYDEVMDIMLREESRLGDRTVTDSRSKRDFIETDEGDSSSDNAILRSMLAKELLCRMYQVNRNMVHYPAMLLAFCKDEDPREGLGKAFTLAMGVRVCTNTVEGERYVEQLVKEKERIRKLKLSRDYLRQEANEITQDIVSYIMNRVDKSISMLEKMRSSDLAPKRRVMVQQLNGLDEIDPADLLPAEVIAEHLVIEDTSIFNAEQEYEATLVSISPATLEDHKENQRDERVIFWLPRNICIVNLFLSACLPRLALQADLFQTSLSLHEGIMRAYDELTDNELNDERDVVLAHRLVNHDFIRELLSASSNFVSKNMSDLLRSILMNRDNVTVDC
ncbi:Sperm flagellar protein [Ooceraea biroi]|uniref:Sperm flagellar protein n=1 Tax=Ooceraea biroi TaxID=2015173 RepID=A0A026VZL8_OOCBI|nr:Sperm flagellar protein [Ooceraea biroi]